MVGQSSHANTESRLTRLPAPLRTGLALAAWLLVLGVAAILAGNVLAALLDPAIKLGAAMLLAEPLSVEHLRFASVQNVPVYEMRAVVESPWTFTNHTVPVGSAVQVTVPRAHTLYHVVIIGAVVLAWPAKNARERGLRMLLGCAAVLLAVSLDAPIALSAQAHALFFERFAPARLDGNGLIALSTFLDHGGRLALAAMLAVLATGLATQLQSGRPTRRRQRG